jgi:hypothetical protein
MRVGSNDLVFRDASSDSALGSANLAVLFQTPLIVPVSSSGTTAKPQNKSSALRPSSR